MSSVLNFSPALNASLSLPNLLSSPHKLLKKQKRVLEPLDNRGGRDGGEDPELDYLAIEKSPPSGYFNAFVTTPDGEISHGINSTHTDDEGLHASDGPQSFLHHITEAASSMVKGRISDELILLKPPLYFVTRKVLTIPAEKISGSMGLRYHHLTTMTAVLHKCLSECDYIRAGRAWAMLLRAEHHGQSIDLRMHDRWGVGAEILMQHESQIAQRTPDHKLVEISDSTSDLGVKRESMEKAKEYYDRLVLQYPYHKAFPHATGTLKFSIAMFSLWVYAVQKRSQIALIAARASNGDVIETNTDASDNVQRFSTSDIESDCYRKREQIRIDTLQSAREIAARLNGLLESPPYSDNAKLRKLCGDISLWTADLSITTIFSDSGSSHNSDDECLTVGDHPHQNV